MLICLILFSFSRKNPVHFQESSHPGDSDYEEEKTEDGDDDERPECPYGTHCYRWDHLKLHLQIETTYKYTADVNTVAERNILKLWIPHLEKSLELL